MISTGSNIYAVSGNKVVKIDALGGVTDVTSGAIPGTDDVFMARNAASPFQIAIVVEGKRYYIESDTLANITDTDLPPPNSVTFADQRIVFSVSDGRIFWSDIDDTTSIDALSFSTAEGAPDGLVRAFTHRLDLWLFGTETTEIWRSTADTDEPFRRVSGGYLQHGCDAHHSVANLGDTLFWINEKHQVVAANGYAPQVISNLDVSRDIHAATDHNQISGFAYYSHGTGFYVLTNTNSSDTEWTWVFNINTGKWLERRSDGSNRWRGLYSARVADKWIVGDGTSANFYEVDQDTYHENDNPITWELRSPPVHAYPHRVSIDRLHLNFVAGVGLNSATTTDSDPQVYLDWSDDGGRNFSTTLQRSLGQQGEWLDTVKFNNLGITGRQGRIFRLRCSAHVARGLRHAMIEGDLVGT
jgi:hypothetical protein